MVPVDASPEVAATWFSPTVVTASVQARAALSRPEKKGVSDQTLTVYNRCSVSPRARASFLGTLPSMRTSVGRFVILEFWFQAAWAGVTLSLLRGRTTRI